MVESGEFAIVQHFPSISGLDMSRERILESEVSKAYKDQEVAKFRANVKRAFQHRIEAFTEDKDHGAKRFAENRRKSMVSFVETEIT